MCGICGIVDFEAPPSRPAVERMTRVLYHRGPDDEGLELLGPAALGFRRLSIIDLVASQQPMSNEDDTVWLLFNGEIYNYRELRKSLESNGHRFKTSGDGETILHLYEEFGDDFVHHLNGMFAIALWDARRERLLLARDRLGVKPIYYSVRGTRLSFASEAKSILEAGSVPRTLDLEAVAAYMNYSSVPGEQTLLKEIRRLPPGHMASFDRRGFRAWRYWRVHYDRQRDWDPHEIEELVHDLLRDSIRMRLVSDVPLGAFLSGGVDSSLISAMMAESSSKPVEAFSIGFRQEGSFMDELSYSKQVADRYGMHHHTLILDSEDLLRDVERVVWFLDEPCGDPAAFLTLALSEFTRRHVTVSLSGLGADELFGGYRRYLAMGWHHHYRRVPRLVREQLIRPLVASVPEARTRPLLNYARVARKFVDSFDDDVRTTWAQTISYLPGYEGDMFGGALHEVRRATYTSDAFDRHWGEVAELGSPIDQVMYMDLEMYLPDQLLFLQDKMSMAASLEARVPFLDYRLVELAATIPARLKIRGRVLKTILKRIAERYVPRDCIYRQKKGFVAPVETWLRGRLYEQVHDALSPRRVRDRGILEVDFVEWMKREFYERGRDLSVQLYQALLLETWLRLFIDGESRKFTAGS